jgi:hypothetical protein
MVYRNIVLPLTFTGELLIGKDFIQEKYIHMGFQPPSSYQTVLELTFVSGLCARQIDKSGEFTDDFAKI